MRFEIIRLQIQIEPLKVGKAPLRRYDPGALRAVTELEITGHGAYGIDQSGARTVDVHNTEHPRSRDPKGNGGLTVIGTGDYRRLRERYGPHLFDGSAGESILVEAPGGLAGLVLPDHLLLHTADGPVKVGKLRVADPCVEFTRYCLGLEPPGEIGPEVKQGLVDLDNGARGYRGSALGAGRLRVGDLVEIDLE